MVSKLLRLHRAGTLGLAIKGQVGGLASRLGEQIGMESLVYNRWTYAAFHRNALECAPIMVSGIMELYGQIRSAVDFGSGTGVYIAELRKRGVATEGFEYSARARSIARKSLGIELHHFDLTTFRNSERRFDLCVCFEVAEHLPPPLGNRLVEVCCNHAAVAVFSAAHPGQGGQGHINEQPKSYWVRKFAELGFGENESKTRLLAQYLRENLIRGLYLVENVGVYERIPSS